MNYFKRVKRKLVASLMVLAMLISVATVLAAAGTPDDIEGHWAQQRIQSWLQQNLASGYPDGTFRPDDEVTRAEFVAFMNRAFDVPETLQTPGFEDVREEDWHYEYVSAAVQEGLLTGYPDDTFRPDNPITREEAAVIVDRLIELEELDTVEPFVDEAEISGWAEEAVDAVSAVEIMTGYPDGTFRPGNPITRAETVYTLDRALEYELPPPVFDVTFYVVDEEEEALQGADVELNDYTETTDAEGQAVFEDVETGYYKYTVSKEGYPSVEDEITVDEDMIVEVELSLAVTVEDEDELDAAMEKENVEEIYFVDDIEADIAVERPLTIDFDEYTLDGDVEFEHEEEGTSELLGTADPSIDGDLTVDTPEASFVNNVVVSGEVTIDAVSPDSWTENADGNSMVINASSVTITISGEPDSVNVSEDGEDITISVEAGEEVEIDIDGDAENVTVNAEEGSNVILSGEGADDVSVEGEGDVEVEEPPDFTPSPDPTPPPELEVIDKEWFDFPAVNEYHVTVENIYTQELKVELIPVDEELYKDSETVEVGEVKTLEAGGAAQDDSFEDKEDDEIVANLEIPELDWKIGLEKGEFGGDAE